jgi:hypothetical protein
MSGTFWLFCGRKNLEESDVNGLYNIFMDLRINVDYTFTDENANVVCLHFNHMPRQLRHITRLHHASNITLRSSNIRIALPRNRVHFRQSTAVWDTSFSRGDQYQDYSLLDVPPCSRVDRCGRFEETYILRRDVLTAMNIKIIVFWNVTPCTVVGRHGRKLLFEIRGSDMNIKNTVF